MSYREKKALLITTALMICLSVFCSFFFIAECADHDCTHDDDCAVCRVIDVCLNTIRGMAADTVLLSVTAAVLIIFIAVSILHEMAYNCETLISLKVELRN